MVMIVLLAAAFLFGPWRNPEDLLLILSLV